MSVWPLWSQDHPEDLIRYVQTTVLSAVMPDGVVLPGRSPKPTEVRLREVFDAFATAGADYADESFTSTGTHQAIRPPDEVFVNPRHANCLDLSVAFAGACLDAGLHPMVVILDPAGAGSAGHALVVVWLAGDWAGPASGWSGDFPYPLTEVVVPRQPGWRRWGLRSTWRESGMFVAVDIAVVARTWRQDDARPSLEDAVAAGGGHLQAERWSWHVGIDVGLGYDRMAALPMPGWPTVPALEPPYHEIGVCQGPLANIRARNNVVRFEDRPELDALLQWCWSRAESDLVPRVVTVRGVGGSGKTRLAAELAHQLGQDGWATGFLRDALLTNTPDDVRALDWLARVASPLLVVIDYVESIPTEVLESVFAYLRQRRQRTVVVLTARDPGDWAPALVRRLGKAGTRVLWRPDEILAEHHPNPVAVYRRAYRRFAALTGTPGDPRVDPPGGLRRWTTLDLLLHAWIAAHNTTDLPATATDLYTEILDREFDHWAEILDSRRHPAVARATLKRLAAAVSLLTPRRDELTTTLEALGIAALAGIPAPILSELLGPPLADTIDADQAKVALRPDPLADHLITTVLPADLALLDAITFHAITTHTTGHLTVTVTRAADNDRAAATALATRILTTHPELWSEAVSVALTQGGPFVTPLEHLASLSDTPLPLARLAESIPQGHSALRPLALLAATRTNKTEAPTTPEERAEVARLLNNLSVRQSESGDRAGALATITEAVTHHRALAEANPAAFLPDLAGSLNNLSVQQSESGDRAGALATITEAVTHDRALAEANPAAFLPDLAGSLNNLSVQQSESGDRAGALATITEAVTLRRQLAEANPGAFLPDLAMSLNNLSVRQSDVGDRAGALAAITEAVTHHRALAEANPGAFLPDLATSLNNLSNQQSDVGDRAGALAAITEAVTHHRALAEANPGAFLPDLATSLNNLSNRQSESGDRAGALAAITEAVTLRRQLAEANPAAFLPDLAGSLNNLSNRQSESGDRAGALATITEAVTHYRALAEANPAAFLPDLATSLNNLSNQQSESGDRAGALATITEAVTHYRALAEANPGAFLPDLATSLNNLSNRQSESGDRAGALATITEAVTLRRQLAEANPGAFLPDLAMSLNNLSVRQSDVGDRAGALATITEAVTHYRALAEANPGAFLPDLAMSLNNLSNQQSDVGDRAGALATITEAVTLRRQLAEANPAAFLPNLAGSLNNLSNQQSDVGDRAGALATITEAVTLRRQLAEANPGAFLPDLARSLNNLSVRQSDVGDRAGALATITEAVTHHRALAEANPGAFLPDLATSLNNLSNRQSESGDRAGALAAITEAVTLRRQLAEANPGAFLPDLAMSLNNLSGRQSESGDRAGALAAITEAVTLRRQLAEANPGAFLPDLARSLNNLSVRQSDVGDRAGALATITEAVTHYRALAEANPGAFLPDLAMSLNNLSNQQWESGDRAAALPHWTTTWTGLAAESTAFLLVARCLWRRRTTDDADLGTDDLEQAARHADEPATDQRLIGEVRQRIRAAAGHPNLPADAGLPPWATVAVPDSTVELVNSWLQCENGSEQVQYLRQHWQTLRAHNTQQELDILTHLHPTATSLDELKDIITHTTENGLDDTIAELSAHDAAEQLVRDWITTPTWTESQRFLEAHPQLITDGLHAAILNNGNDDTLRQHLGILLLARHHPLGEIFDAVLDRNDAHALLFKVISHGNTDLIRALWFAAPTLPADDFARPTVIAVLTALDDEPDPDLPDLATAAHAAASERDRVAALRALRELNRSLDNSSIGQVIDTFAASPDDDG